MAESEIVSFKHQRNLQAQSAQHGLYGLAAVASHESITARMERGAARLLQLIHEGKHQEAFPLMETTSWAVEEIETAYHTTTPV